MDDTFWQTIKVGNQQGGGLVEVEALVDTGALDTMIPASLLIDLGVQVLTSYNYILADGRMAQLPYGQAAIEIDGATRICPVVFGPGDEVLLGATTLETFKLLVDPNDETLLPGDVWPMGGGRKPRPIRRN